MGKFSLGFIESTWTMYEMRYLTDHIPSLKKLHFSYEYAVTDSDGGIRAFVCIVKDDYDLFSYKVEIPRNTITVSKINIIQLVEQLQAIIPALILSPDMSDHSVLTLVSSMNPCNAFTVGLHELSIYRYISK